MDILVCEFGVSEYWGLFDVLVDLFMLENAQKIGLTAKRDMLNAYCKFCAVSRNSFRIYDEN